MSRSVACARRGLGSLTTAVLPVVVLLWVCLYVGFASADGGSWAEGRATFYGNEPWLWDIHYG